MAKQSRVVRRSVSPAPTRVAAVLQEGAAARVRARHSRWKGLGRASGLFTVGLLAALAAPREAKAVGYFTDNTPTSLGVGAQQPCGDSIVAGASSTTWPDYGCYTSWLETVDIDGDGDFDILMANGGGYYATGVAEESTVYINDGHAAFHDVTPTTFGGAHNRSKQVAAGDIDGDGDIDIYQPGGFGVDLDRLWVQASPGVFEDKAATLLPTAGLKSHAASVHMGDLDGDGDLDIVIGDWNTPGTSVTSRLIMYFNDGHVKFSLGAVQPDPQFATSSDRFPPTIPFANSTALPYYGVRAIDLDFADVDGDFDLDILINHRNGFSRIFLNDGHANFSDGTNFVATTNPDTTVTIATNYPQKQGPGQYVYNQEVCDIDEDGDLDILLDNAGKPPEGTVCAPQGACDVSQVLINDGHGKFIDDTANRIFGEPGSDDNAVKCVDINNDGHYDLLVASLQNTSEKLLLNDGTGKFNYVADAFPAVKDVTLGIDIADLNGDGIIDVVTGQGEGSYAKDGSNALTLRTDRVYFGAGAAAVDTIAPVFRAIETPVPVSGQPTVIRMAVKDSATNEAGQMVRSVSVSYAVPGGTTKVAKAAFIGGDLFRAVIPLQPAGTQITATPSTTDRVGLTKTAPAMVFTIPTGGGGTGGLGGTGGGGAGGGDTAGTTSGGTDAGGTDAGGTGTGEAGMSSTSGGDGGMSSGGSSTGGMSTGGSSAMSDDGGDSSGGTSSKPSGASKDDDGGCSVSNVPANKSRGGALAFGFGLALLGFVRRRRNK